MAKASSSIDLRPAKDASKTATNYLSFDETNGLDIGYTGKTERTNIKGDGMRIYDANSTTDPVASFLSTGSQIGRDGESRVVLTPDGQSIVSGNNVEWFNVKKSGHPSSERYRYSEKGTVAASPSISLSKAPATGTVITVETEIGSTNAFPAASRTTNSFTVGTSSTVTNTYVDSSGTAKWTVSYNAQNNGTISAAFTTANGWKNIMLHVSYLTDSQSIDLGVMSFGYAKSIEGNGSILLGRGLSGGSDNQLIIGRHNIKDSANKYAFIIGNGSEETPSNALTIDWNGVIYGNIKRPRDGVYSSDIRFVPIGQTGQCLNSYAYIQGNLCHIVFKVQRTDAATPAGGDIFNGKLSNTGLYPKWYVSSGSYYGNYSIGGAFGTTGNVVVRNATNREFPKLSGSNNISISFTYVLA